MARRLGTGSISSLTRTASAALDRKQAYDDATKAYEFQISGKDPQAYQDYTNYLATRAKGVSDPMKQLSLQKTMDDARHSFRSSELQRENIQINYGNASLTDKRNLLDRQYQEAINNGDYTLAQTIESQRGATDIAIQNAADAAASKAQAAGDRANRAQMAAFHAGLNDQITKLKHDETAIDNAYRYGDTIQPTDENGHPVGPPVRVTAANKDQLKGAVLQRQSSALQNGIKGTDDPNLKRTLGNELTTLQGRPEYVGWANGAGKGEAARRGEVGFARHWNPNTKQYEDFKLDVESSIPAIGPDGKPLMNTDLTGNSTGEQKTVDRFKEGLYKGRNAYVSDYNAEGQRQFDASDIQKDAQGHPYIDRLANDPGQPGKLVSRRFYVNPNAKEGEPGLSLKPFPGTGNFGSDVADAGGGIKEWIKENPALAGSVEPLKAIAGGVAKGVGALTANGGKAVKDVFGDAVQKSPFGIGMNLFNSLKGYGKNVDGAGNAQGMGLGGALTNPAGFIANLLGVNATKMQDAKNLAALESKRQAAIQAQNAQSAAEAKQAAANFAAQQAIQQKASMASKSYNPSVAQAPPASQIYGTTGGSPAANAAAVSGAYPNPRSSSAVAAGIGAAAGYNPNWLINPKF